MTPPLIIDAPDFLSDSETIAQRRARLYPARRTWRRHVRVLLHVLHHYR